MFQKCAASWIIKNKFEAIHNWDFLEKKKRIHDHTRLKTKKI